MSQKHSIGSVTLQVHASRQADGFALQQDVSRWFWEGFLPVLDDLLSELAPEGELIRLDHLDLQLPALSPDLWRKELTVALRAALQEKLEQLIRYPKAGEAGIVARIPVAQSHLEAWLWFLEHGSLPQQYAAVEETDLQLGVLESVATQTIALEMLRTLLRRSPVALQRLALQHNAVFLTRLSTAITGREMNLLAKQASVVHDFLYSPALQESVKKRAAPKVEWKPKSFSRRQLETRFWQQAFEILASEPESFEVQTFTGAFFETQFEESFETSFKDFIQTSRQVDPDQQRQIVWVDQLDFVVEELAGSDVLRQHLFRETEIVRQTLAAHALSEASRKPATSLAEEQERKHLPEKSHFETWLWLLQKGELPANPAAGNMADRLASGLKTLQKELESVGRLSRLIRHQPKALQRLVLEHDIAFLTLLVEAITGKKLGLISKMPKVFYKALTDRMMQGLVEQAFPHTKVLNAIVVPESSFEIWFWQELLFHAASDVKNFDNQIFANSFFKQAFPLIYKIPFSEVIEQVMQAAAISVKQRKVVLRTLEKLQLKFNTAEPLKTFFQQEIEPQRQKLMTGDVHADARLTPDEGEIPSEVANTVSVGHFEAWIWFLQYGHFPGGYTTGRETEATRLQVIVETLSARPTALKSLRRLLLRQPVVIERLVLQHQPDFLADLAMLIANQPLPALPEQSDTIYNFLASAPVQDLVQQALPQDDCFSASPLAARQLALWFWQELFLILAESTKKIDYQVFIRNFFFWSFQRVFAITFQEWTQRAKLLNESSQKKHAALKGFLSPVAEALADNKLLQEEILQLWEPVLKSLHAPPRKKGAAAKPPVPEDQNEDLLPVSRDSSPAAPLSITENHEPVADPNDLVADNILEKKPATEPPKVQYLQNAGLVVLHPFLGSLFETIGITKEGEMVDEDTRARAVQLLHYLATGSSEAPEYALGMAKFLCGMPHDMPIDRVSLLSEQDVEEADAMLQAVIEHWEALGKVSNDSLREGFLQRDGKLSRRDGDWLLQVESKTLDILIGRLPWGLSIVKLPWMPEMLHVEWS